MSADDFFKIANYVLQIWKEIPRIRVLNQEATINVPEALVEYTIAVSVPSSFRSLRKPIQFKSPSIIRVTVVSLHPFFGTIRDAVKRYEYEDGSISFVLFPELLLLIQILFRSRLATKLTTRF